MISRLRGTVASHAEGMVEIETDGGVTYEVNVPAPVLVGLRGREGSELELLTHQVFTENSAAIYGFGSSSERLLFTLLLSAQGVGARLALAMMSTLTPDRLARALVEADYAVLAQVPGIGRRTAEKISVSLKNKVKALAAVAPEAERTPGDGSVGQAVAALVGLGMAAQEADRRVRAVLAESVDGSEDEVSAEELIRRALAGPAATEDR
ncbi:MAG: Holliday junction branch migration protein RuvA [Gemmatimonadetes bacterium]|nr:Holliday junction branch migration protein RuvA [Gemmatimonadota bacterium]